MPELPEVEAVCRRLRREAIGATIAAAHFPRPNMTAPQVAKTVARKAGGKSITGVRRRGKNILVELSGELTLHVHLKMTGNLYVVPDQRLRPVMARAWFDLDDGRALVFDDPRAIGRIRMYTAEEAATKMEEIGVEPLSAEFTEDAFVKMARKSRKPVKLFLLDQRHVAGIGNIYAAEALFEAGIDPRKPAGGISHARLRLLRNAIVGVLNRAVQSACNAYTTPGRFREAEGFLPQVYDREGEVCGVCHRTIRRMEQGGRSTYFCPGCQK